MTFTEEVDKDSIGSLSMRSSVGIKRTSSFVLNLISIEPHIRSIDIQSVLDVGWEVGSSVNDTPDKIGWKPSRTEAL